MRKRDELTSPDSCLSKATDGEMLFVLLGRDECAPAAVRFWMSERVRTGLNMPGDGNMQDAERCARLMETDQLKVRRREDLAVAKVIRADLDAASKLLPGVTVVDERGKNPPINDYGDSIGGGPFTPTRTTGDDFNDGTQVQGGSGVNTDGPPVAPPLPDTSKTQGQ